MELYGRIVPMDAITKDEDLLRAIISSLPFGEGERERLLGIRNEATLRESLAAWLALWDLLQILSIPLPQAVLRTPAGKPYFEDPSLPSFSLSHTDTFAVAVISSRGAVGVDVEGGSRRLSFDRIAKRYFSDAEQTLLGQSSVPYEAFLKIWTKKEALAKMTGDGLSAIVAEESVPEGSVYSFQVKKANVWAHLSIATELPAKSLHWPNHPKEIFISR